MFDILILNIFINIYKIYSLYYISSKWNMYLYYRIILKYFCFIFNNIFNMIFFKF